MAFNGTEGAPIDINEAAQLTSNWRNANPNQPIAHFIGKDNIEALLNQGDAMGIRIYYGLNDDGVMKPIFVAASSDENDMLELAINSTLPCPNRCSSANALNS